MAFAAAHQGVRVRSVATVPAVATVKIVRGWQYRPSSLPSHCEILPLARVISGNAESVAIESVEPLAVLELQATLRLDDFENQSYPLALSRILGITPLPDEAGTGQDPAVGASPRRPPQG